MPVCVYIVATCVYMCAYALYLYIYQCMSVHIFSNQKMWKHNDICNSGSNAHCYNKAHHLASRL